MDPAAYGERVYAAQVYPLKGEHTARFTYERRVKATETGLQSTCISRDARGTATIDIAEHATNWSLTRFTEYQFQVGEVDTVEVHGREVTFRSRTADGERTAKETVSLPVLVGPTVYGFVLSQWDALAAHKVVPIRLAVTSRRETIGFEFERLADGANGEVRVQLKASSPFVALVVKPSVITFSADKKPVSYDGRVPMLVDDGGKWADFDGHVEYAVDALAYR
jgi:hypothetical protein